MNFQKYIYGENNCEFQLTGDEIAVKNRKEAYETPAMRVNEALGEKEAYYFSAKLRTDSEKEFPFVATFKMTIEYLDLKYTTYHFGAQKMIGKAFSEVHAEVEIPAGARLIELIAYFVQRGSKEILPDLYVKDFFVEERKATLSVIDRENRYPIKRQKETTVGAIRWDAYGETGTEDSFVSDQVARALSEYPENAPFFAYRQDNKICFPAPTQEQFDLEAKLAEEAGIDYFAYCWYKNSSAMAYAREQHLKTPHKIKMCAILGVSALDGETLESLCASMKSERYLKFDERPVVYVYDAFNFSPSAINTLESTMKACGISEKPYYIGMAHKASPFIINTMLAKGIDALSAYACVQREDTEPFSHHAKNVNEENDSRAQYFKSLDIVPLISCGRDSRPRIKNPVSWAGDYGGKYIIQPTFDELYSHVREVLCQLKDGEKYVPNTALIYAWNEHDEGAWCCPTLASEGKKMNTLFLDALKKAIEENKKS